MLFAKYVLGKTMENWKKLEGTVCPWGKAPYAWQKAAYNDMYTNLWALVHAGEHNLPQDVIMPKEFEGEAFDRLILSLDMLDDLCNTGDISYWTDREGNFMPSITSAPASVPDAIQKLYDNYWVDWTGSPVETYVANLLGQNGILLSFKTEYPSILISHQDKMPISLGYEILKAEAKALTQRLVMHTPDEVSVLFGENTAQDSYEVCLFFPKEVCEQMLGPKCETLIPGAKKLLGWLKEAQMEVCKAAGLASEAGKPNTKIEYLYRDASNYKVWNSVVVSGSLSEGEQKEILDCLQDGDSFIPSQVGLDETRFGDWTEDDGPWFELYSGFATPTVEKPTTRLTAQELVAAFKAAKGNWDAGDDE